MDLILRIQQRRFAGTDPVSRSIKRLRSSFRERKEKPSVRVTLTSRRVDVNPQTPLPSSFFAVMTKNLVTQYRVRQGSNYFISFKTIFWTICKVRMLILKITATKRLQALFIFKSNRYGFDLWFIAALMSQ
jgi:hypothetical protein